MDGIVLAALKSEKDLDGELGMSSHVQRLNLISHVKVRFRPACRGFREMLVGYMALVPS